MSFSKDKNNFKKSQKRQKRQIKHSFYIYITHLYQPHVSALCTKRNLKVTKLIAVFSNLLAVLSIKLFSSFFHQTFLNIYIVSFSVDHVLIHKFLNVYSPLVCHFSFKTHLLDVIVFSIYPLMCCISNSQGETLPKEKKNLYTME